MTTGVLEKPTATPGRAANYRDELVSKLYRNHAVALEGYVTALLEGDRHTAADVVQETALRAWKHADRLDEGSPSFRPWLLKVARRLVIDRYRQRVSRPAEVGGETPDWLAQIGDESERTLASMVVSDALRSLSTDHRDVIVELYFRGRSVDEAAAVLGIPAGTVKSRTYYAMRSLRTALAQRGLTSPA
jgi:RNA polymerase sigma-70 factor (ECF subfamily)